MLCYVMLCYVMTCCDCKKKGLRELQNDDFVPVSDLEGILNLSTTDG